MAGREKIPCYEYGADYSYLRSYDSIQEVRDKYFSDDIGKRPLFKSGKDDYFKLENGNFIANYRIGRERLRKFERIKNCKFCSNHLLREDKKVEVFNLKNEKIAEFKNVYIASIITGISQKTVWCRLNATSSKYRNKPNKDNLEFRYKTN